MPLYASDYGFSSEGQLPGHSKPEDHPYQALIETNAAIYFGGFHLGTEEQTARWFVEDIFKHRKPLVGQVIRKVHLKRGYGGADHVATYDGQWSDGYTQGGQHASQ